MAYDPADLRLPPWLLRLFDGVVGIQWRLGGSWRLRLTRPGALYLSTLIGIWSAAFYSGNNLLYLCGAMLTSVGLLAAWQGVVCLRSIPSLIGVLPNVSEAGAADVLREPVKSSFSMSAWVDIQWYGKDMSLPLQWRNGEESIVMASICATERGLHRLEQQKLTTSAPLGLWELSCERFERCDWSVMPAAVAWQEGGEARRLLEGDEWRDLRAYVPGDALSRVHWRKSAQNLSNWMIKRFDSSENEENQRKSDVLRVDLRMPAQADRQAFEHLLGQAWFWLKAGGVSDRKLMLGQLIFDLNDAEQYAQACRQLALVETEESLPVGSGGVLLSLRDHG